jgi:hypothetical protein
MGSLALNPNSIAAFTGQSFPNGLDLARCQINNELGIWSADPVATFLQGMLVVKGANGITAVNGSGVTSGQTNTLGVAKWNKANSLYAVVNDEPLLLKQVAGGAKALAHANVSNVAVRITAGANVVPEIAAQYTLNPTNGTILPKASGDTSSTGTVNNVDQTVYVTYTYALSATDLDMQGRNFWNFTDDVSIQAGAITVISPPAMLFTTQYDTSVAYAITGTPSNLYASSTGLFTSAITANAFVGTVIQVPSATDPYLGLMYTGPIAVRT